MRAADILVSAIDALSVGVAALIGFALSAVVTATHSALPPWGMALGVLAIAALVVGYRLAFGVRRHAIGGVIGVVVAVGVFSQEGQGGTVLVGNDVVGWTWVIAAPLVAAAAVLVPLPGAEKFGTSDAA